MTHTQPEHICSHLTLCIISEICLSQILEARSFKKQKCPQTDIQTQIYPYIKKQYVFPVIKERTILLKWLYLIFQAFNQFSDFQANLAYLYYDYHHNNHIETNLMDIYSNLQNMGGPFLWKNHLCWEFLSLLYCTSALTLSSLLKLPSKKLKSWFVKVFLLLKLLFTSINYK